LLIVIIPYQHRSRWAGPKKLEANQAVKAAKISLLDCFDLHEPSITNALTAIEGVNEERKINFEEMKGKNPENEK